MSDRARETTIKNSIAFRKRQKTYAAFGGVKAYLEAVYGRNERGPSSGEPEGPQSKETRASEGGVSR